MPCKSTDSRRFTISWHDELGYRVSIPNFLTHGERVEVMPVGEHEQLVEAMEACARWAEGYDGEIAYAIRETLRTRSWS